MTMSYNYIIPGVLAEISLGADCNDKLGYVSDDAVIVLNTDFKHFADTKAAFCKVCKLGIPKLIVLQNHIEQKRKKGLLPLSEELAASIELTRRRAAQQLYNAKK